MSHPEATPSSAVDDPSTVTGPGGRRPSERRGRLATVRDSAGAGIGAAMGLLPHLLHHVGLLAGAAVVTGLAGNAAFFALGLLFSVPLLRRLYRRRHSWRSPAIAVVVFAALFSLSAFVIGPAITGDSANPDDKSPIAPTQTPSADHTEHHGN